MKILIKIPSRERPDKLIDLLDLYYSMINDPSQTRFLFTFDEDDAATKNSEITERLQFLERFYGTKADVVYGYSKNKIDAVNRDLEKFMDWDILVLASDDMVPLCDGYDRIIRDDMVSFNPDLDGVLYYPDGYTPLNTLPVIGKKYYLRFNYIYNPIYESFFCDNEFHSVAELLGKHKRREKVLFKHFHPANTGQGNDDLYIRNNKPWERDKKRYEERTKERFGIKGDVNGRIY